MNVINKAYIQKAKKFGDSAPQSKIFCNNNKNREKQREKQRKTEKTEKI